MMKKLFSLLCCCLTMTPLSAQDLPSKAVYLAQKDSLSKEFAAAVDKWNKTIPPYYREAIRLEKEAKNHPEWKDSLLAAAAEKRRMGDSFKPELQARLDVIQAEKRALGDRYALIFEEAFSYFQRRKDFSKDSLAVLLSKASVEIRESEKGRALRNYIEHDQLEEGQPFLPFPCYDVEGKPFDWNLTKGKKVFLVHDGLWCMTHGQDNSLFSKYLQHLHEVAPDCFPLIVINGADREDIRDAITEYSLQGFHVVSEFQKDLGILNWLYNDQDTPTCHFINEQGIVVKTTVAVDEAYLEKVFLGI